MYLHPRIFWWCIVVTEIDAHSFTALLLPLKKLDARPKTDMLLPLPFIQPCREFFKVFRMMMVLGHCWSLFLPYMKINTREVSKDAENILMCRHICSCKNHVVFFWGWEMRVVVVMTQKEKEIHQRARCLIPILIYGYNYNFKKDDNNLQWYDDCGK